MPEDLEVIVYGNNESLEVHSPSVTTVQYPTEDIARECITVMAELLDKPEPSRPQDPETPFVFRESCPP